MSLNYLVKLEMLIIQDVLLSTCYKRNSIIYRNLTVISKFAGFDQFSTVCGPLGYTARCTKRILDLSMMPPINGCRNDDVIQLDPLCSQSLFQFVPD